MKEWRAHLQCSNLVFNPFKVPNSQLNTWCFISQKSNVSSSNAWCFIFQKTNFPSSMLDVLSSKRLTFQAQCLMFYLPKVQLSKLNTWCFIFQKTNFPSSNVWCFIFQKTNVQSLKVQLSKFKSSTFQAQKPRFQVLNLAVRPYFVYPFALFSFSFSVLFHPFL